MHVPINLKSPNNISEGQKGINSAFKGLMKIKFFWDVMSRRLDGISLKIEYYDPPKRRLILNRSTWHEMPGHLKFHNKCSLY